VKKLILSVLLLFPWTALAGEPLQSEATTPLLTAITEAGNTVQDLAGTPAPQWKTGCSANLTCANQCGPISCNGVSTCSVGSNSVTCDGNTTFCPYPTCTPPVPCINLGTGCDWCACIAAGGTPGSCRYYCFP